MNSFILWLVRKQLISVLYSIVLKSRILHSMYRDNKIRMAKLILIYDSQKKSRIHVTNRHVSTNRHLLDLGLIRRDNDSRFLINCCFISKLKVTIYLTSNRKHFKKRYTMKVKSVQILTPLLTLPTRVLQVSVYLTISTSITSQQ